MADLTGQRLGNYRLTRLLGKGGFGQVYLGEQVYLKTYAAIKLLLEESSDTQGEAFDMAFLQEARRIAALKHPHILRVLEFGIEKATPYLVMEYAAHGTILERHPRGTRVPLGQVVSYTKQIAQALHYAHQARLIHRDVKPANVLLDEQDTVLLSDFGIATIAHHTSSMRTSSYAGTAAYMAPEQLQGKPVPASDQYALAVMVYEWLCGQLPYQGDPVSVGMQHLVAPIPSLRTHNKAVSSGVEAVVQRAMAKDPEQRFAHVEAFATALEQASRDGQRPSETSSQTIGSTRQQALPPVSIVQSGSDQQSTWQSFPPPSAVLPPQTGNDRQSTWQSFPLRTSMQSSDNRQSTWQSFSPLRPVSPEKKGSNRWVIGPVILALAIMVYAVATSGHTTTILPSNNASTAASVSTQSNQVVKIYPNETWQGRLLVCNNYQYIADGSCPAQLIITAVNGSNFDGKWENEFVPGEGFENNIEYVTGVLDGNSLVFHGTGNSTGTIVSNYRYSCIINSDGSVSGRVLDGNGGTFTLSKK